MEPIEEAILLKNELDSIRPLSKEQEEIIMQKFRLDWNYNSNNLEGNSLTYGETKALLLHVITAQGKPLKNIAPETSINEKEKMSTLRMGIKYPESQAEAIGTFLKQVKMLVKEYGFEVE